MINWHKFIQLNISRVPLFTETSLNVTVLVLHRVKISFDYGTNNYNPIQPGIKAKTISSY